MATTESEDLLADPVIRGALEELARKEWELESIRAQQRQDAMDSSLREGVFLDGMGGCERRVDAFAFHHWGKELNSYHCWSDRGFLKYFDRIAPETRVRSRSAKLQIGYTPAPNFAIEVRERQAPKFTKTYREEVRGERGEVRGEQAEVRTAGAEPLPTASLTPLPSYLSPLTSPHSPLVV